MMGWRSFDNTTLDSKLSNALALNQMKNKRPITAGGFSYSYWSDNADFGWPFPHKPIGIAMENDTALMGPNKTICKKCWAHVHTLLAYLATTDVPSDLPTP